MAANIHDGGRRVTCARCDFLIGDLPNWTKAGWRLGLSLKWYYDASLGRWRRGSHLRRWNPWRRGAFGGDSGADVVNDSDLRRQSWRVPLPAVVECPRCRSVQEVGIPPAR